MNKKQKRLVVVLEKQEAQGVSPTWTAKSVRSMTILERAHLLASTILGSCKRNNANQPVLAETDEMMSVGVSIDHEQYAKLIGADPEHISMGCHVMGIVPEVMATPDREQVSV